MRLFYYSLIVVSICIGCKSEPKESSLSSNGIEPWSDSAIFEINKEPVRTDYMPYESADKARVGTPTQSAYFKSLDAFWKIHHTTNANDLNQSLEKAGKSLTWKDINFPNLVELKGHGKAIYKHFAYPFASNYPEIPNIENSISTFKTEIDIPANWSDRQNYIVLEGVASAYKLFVNGSFIGYSEDSRAVSEFNISKALKQGKNEIAIQVIKWSDGSYLESHAMWHMSGVYRRTYLLSRPSAHLKDFYAKTDLVENMSKGALDLDLTFNKITDNTTQTITAQVTLYENGESVLQEKKNITLDVNSGTTLNIDMLVPNITAWNAELPYLYDMELQIKNDKNQAIEVIRYPIGFKKIERKNDGLVLNGKRIKIKGVTKSEFHPALGYANERTWMENEMNMIKDSYINALRGYNYPLDPYFYQLADQLGFYVFDIANLSILGMKDQATSFANNPEHKDQFINRVRNMFERNKNHACVIAWGVGNELPNGTNTDAAVEWLNQRDSARLVFGSNINTPTVDIAAPIGNITEKKSSRLFVAYEFAAALGNSLGGITETWNTILSNPACIGGFLTEWNDQTFILQNSKQQYFWAYGGDFGKSSIPSDSFMCNQGIVYADNKNKNLIHEMRSIYSPFTIKAVNANAGLFEVTNNMDFKTNTEFVLTSEIKSADEKFVNENVDIKGLKPGQKKQIKIIYKNFKPSPGKDYFAEIQITRIQNIKGKMRFINSVFSQFRIGTKNPLPRPSTSHLAMLDSKEDEQGIAIIGNTFSVKFDKQDGLLKSFKYHNTECLFSPLRPLFYRASTDVDLVSGNHPNIVFWKNITDQFKGGDLKRIKKSGNTVVIESKTKIAELQDAMCHIQYTIYQDATVKVDMQLDLSTGDFYTKIPRFGMTAELPILFKKLQWYGRGQQDTYADRKSFSYIGNYNKGIWDLFGALIRPQESCNKQDVSWANIGSLDSMAIFIQAQDKVNLNVFHFPYSNLMPVFGRNLHGVDITPADRICLIVDAFQQGLGNLHNPQSYTNTNKILKLSYTLRPYSDKQYSAEQFSTFAYPK